MNSPVSIKLIKLGDERKIKVVAPYHPYFPIAARKLGGRWSGEQRAWYFDPRDADDVHQLVLRIYGYDPLAEKQDLVTARVTLSREKLNLPLGSQFFLFGREIAFRLGRDSAVQLGEGVVVLSGGFPRSGGSMKHPSLETEDGTVIEVRDVPRSLVLEEQVRYPDTVEIVEHAQESALLQALAARSEEPASAPVTASAPAAPAPAPASAKPRQEEGGDRDIVERIFRAVQKLSQADQERLAGLLSGIWDDAGEPSDDGVAV